MATQKLEITAQTLTPLWTGGISGTMGPIHETGIIGSLRWWYETIVRGLGGYVSNPTSDKSDERSEFDTKAYEQAKQKMGTDEALQEGLKGVCPVSYLFGATGWARLFQLRVVKVPTTFLHFRSSVYANRNWLQSIFGGENKNIDNIQVPYGDLSFQIIFRNHDIEYAQGQFLLALHFAAQYGGLGARLQHGFGQIAPIISNDNQAIIKNELAKLTNRLHLNDLRASGPSIETPYNLGNFVTLTYEIPAQSLSTFMTKSAHVGNSQKRNEVNYIPCALDLRYKGPNNWGMRYWLKNKKGWRESDREDHLGPLDRLMGPRSQWKVRGETKMIEDKLRTASRLSFSMPYRVDGDNYHLRVFGFAPPDLLTPEELKSLATEYMDYTLKIQPTSALLGKELVARVQGEQ